ncbi:extensin family protein [Sphingomonas sp. FW199]|uniref:extensin-like domain-containing protein n=1 Tax=Sphingomonas sp. FW199 TaxID=3400217 RepID=UPI003CE8B576
MRTVRRTLGAVTLIAILLAGALLLYAAARKRPQDMPWTELDLSQPVGLFTGRKLTALTSDYPACRGLLDRAGVRFESLPPVSDGQCGYADAVRLADGGARSIDLTPQRVGMACPVAAALMLWEWQVLQPAARRHFGPGVRVSRIDHFGSYSCRRMYGRSEGAFSEHSTADALDVAGFVLSDGTRIRLINDWQDDGAKGAFLREVRDGACDLFATVLSPDYNAAHADHFHLDQAERGAMGWRACR